MAAVARIRVLAGCSCSQCHPPPVHVGRVLTLVEYAHPLVRHQAPWSGTTGRTTFLSTDPPFGDAVWTSSASGATFKFVMDDHRVDVRCAPPVEVKVIR